MLSVRMSFFICDGNKDDPVDSRRVGATGAGRTDAVGAIGAIGNSASRIISASIYGNGLGCQRTNAVLGLIIGDPLGSKCGLHSEKVIPGTMISDPFKIILISYPVNVDLNGKKCVKESLVRVP
jgi:hypothetical protein